LVAVDDQPLPIRLHIGGREYLVEAGELELDEQARYEGDGAVRWRLFGTHPDGRKDMIFTQREPYHRLDAGRLEFSVSVSQPAEYLGEMVGTDLVLSSHAQGESSTVRRVFGVDHQWRFVTGTREPTSTAAA
jgi:hypothetical protein